MIKLIAIFRVETEFNSSMGLCVLSFKGEYRISFLIIISLITILTILLFLINLYCWRVVSKVAQRFKNNSAYFTGGHRFQNKCQPYTKDEVDEDNENKIHFEKNLTTEMAKNTSLHATPPYSQPTTINMLSYAKSAPTSPRLTSGATSSFSGTEDEFTRKRNKLPSLTDRKVVMVEGNDSVVTENSTPRTSMSSYRRPVGIYRYRTERERKGKVFYRTLVGVSGVTTVFLVTWLPVLSQLLLAVLSQSVNIFPPTWLDKVVLFATEIAVWCNLFVYWTVR